MKTDLVDDGRESWSRRPRIYVAGPVRAATPWEVELNLRRAEELGFYVARLGGVPVITQSMYRFFGGTLDDDFFVDAGISLLSTCSALALCAPDDACSGSRGTAGELLFAELRGLPVFHLIYSNPRIWVGRVGGEMVPLVDWISSWRMGGA